MFNNDLIRLYYMDRYMDIVNNIIRLKKIVIKMLICDRTLLSYYVLPYHLPYQETLLNLINLTHGDDIK